MIADTRSLLAVSRLVSTAKEVRDAFPRVMGDGPIPIHRASSSIGEAIAHIYSELRGVAGSGWNNILASLYASLRHMAADWGVDWEEVKRAGDERFNAEMM